VANPATTKVVGAISESGLRGDSVAPQRIASSMWPTLKAYSTPIALASPQPHAWTPTDSSAL
jgi:hypothetical protein